MKENFIREQLNRAHIDINFLYELGVASNVYVQSLALKLFVFFRHIDRKSIVQGLKGLTDVLFLSYSRIKDLTYRYPEVRLPVVFGITLTKIDEESFWAEYYHLHLKIKTKKRITLPEIAGLLGDKPVKVINNSIIRGYVLPENLRKELISQLIVTY